MSSAGSIFVDLLLNDSKYSDRLNSASRKTATWSAQTTKQFKSAAPAVDSVTSAIARLGGVAAGVLTIDKIIAYSDGYKSLQSRLALVTDSTKELNDVTQSLIASSNQNFQPLDATIDAYTRLENSLNGAQKSQVDLLKFTDLLSKTLLISGTNAAGAATFFQQFGQAASSDFKAVGQELQTFADQNPRLYGILQNEAAKYGKTLKQMAADGELSFEFIADAVNKNADSISADAARMGVNLEKAGTKFSNTLQVIVGQSDVLNGSTGSLASAISKLADELLEANNEGVSFESTMVGVGVSVLEFYKNIQEFRVKAADKIGLGWTQNVADIKKDIDDINKLIEQAGQGLLERQQQRENKRNDDTPTNPGKTDRAAIDPGPTKEAIQAEKELTALYDKHEAALTGISDQMLKYNKELEDYKKLLDAGKISLDQYNTAVAASTEEFQKSQDKAAVWSFDMEAASKRAAENIQDTLADFLFDPFDKGLDGMLLGFVNVLRKMAAEAAAANLLKGLFGSGGFGSGQGILGGLFSSGTEAVASGLNNAGFGDQAYSLLDNMYADGGFLPPGQFGIAGEREAELIYGGRTGMTVIPPGKMGGDSGNTYNIDARGADAGAVARIQTALLTLAGPGRVENRVTEAQKRGAL